MIYAKNGTPTIAVRIPRGISAVVAFLAILSIRMR
jgi:hypothetical protein